MLGPADFRRASDGEALATTLSPGGGMGMYDEQIRQNLAMFDRAMKMFSPFAFGGGSDTAAAPARPAESPTAPTEDSLSEMKKQLEAMQAQIAKLASKD